MKNLLTKFKLSNALDEKAGESLPDSLRAKMSGSPELNDFAQRTAALDRALSRPPARPTSDPTLHKSIMRAVRASAVAPAPSRVSFGMGMATALAALAGIVIWLEARPTTHGLPPAPSKAQTMAAAQAVMEIGSKISRTMPSAVVGPLSNELACVDRDLRDTTQFVMGVLP